MLVCDRCGDKIPSGIKRDENYMTIYSAQGAYIGHRADLCKNCKRLFEEYKNKMESYFMVNDEPIKILDDERYWDSKRKYQ